MLGETARPFYCTRTYNRRVEGRRHTQKNREKNSKDVRVKPCNDANASNREPEATGDGLLKEDGGRRAQPWKCSTRTEICPTGLFADGCTFMFANATSCAWRPECDTTDRRGPGLLP